MRRRGLLILSAALVLVGAITACALNAGRNRDEKKTEEPETIVSYVYGTMDKYLAAPSTLAKAGSYSQKLVTVVASPASGGSVTPSAYVVEGSTITLTAVPASGFRFEGWQDAGGTVLSTSPSFVTPAVTADVTYTAKFSKESYVVTGRARVDGVESNLAGIVTGGGTISGTDKVTFSLSLPTVKGYSFSKWTCNMSDNTHDQTTVTVGLAGSGANIIIDPSKYNGTEPIVYAEYAKEKGNTTRAKTITATLYPGMGALFFGADKTFTYPYWPGESTVSYRGSGNDLKNCDYLKVLIRNSTTTKPGSTDTQPEYELQAITVEYDYLDSSGNVLATRTNLNIENDAGYDTEAKNKDKWYISLSSYINAAYSYLNVYVFLRANDTAFQEIKSLTTVAIPTEYGVTAGDMQAKDDFTTTITATPYEGYAFDHWEWANNGKTNIIKDNKVSVHVTGQITYMAFFSKAKYDVSVESMSPPSGGIVKSGLGSYNYKDSVTVNIVPNEGYEFKSCSYTTKDGETHTYETPMFIIPEIKENIYLNITFKQKKFTVTAKPEPLGKESGDYNKVKISSGTTSNETTDTITSVEMPLTSAGSVTLTATPNIAAGYKFDKWVGTDGSTSTANPYTPAAITEDVTYIAQFTKDKYKITVQADPSTNGNAYVYDTATGSASNMLTSLEVDLGGSATIEAIENTGYEFLYWTTSNGTKLYEKKIELTGIKSDETFTAHFSSELQITVGHTPAGAAEVKLDIEGGTAGSFEAGGTHTVMYGSNIILTARSTDEKKYRFVRWQDGSGFNYSENPVKIVNVTAADTFVAVYEPIKSTVTVNEDPVDGGKAYVKGNSGVFKRDSDEIDVGGTVELKAEPDTGYDFLYWTSSAGTRYSGTTDASGVNTFNLTNVGSSETFTAHFGKKEVTLTLNTSPAGVGTVQLSGVTLNGSPVAADRAERLTQKVDGGTNATLTAFSNDENQYKFTRWVDSKGNSYSTNPLELVNIVEDETYTAVFSSAIEVNNITVKASPPEGGIVSKTVNDDGSTTIKAVANTGYTFLYWMSSEGTKIMTAEATVRGVGWDEVYTAYFGKTTVTINVKLSPVDAGTLKAAGTEGGAAKTATGTEINGFTVDGGTNVTLTSFSIDENKYKFVKWVDSRGNSYNTNPLEIVDVTEDETYTAIYSSTGDVNEITVKASPPEGGKVSKVINGDGTTTIKAEANPGYTFMYWLSSTGTKMTQAEVILSNIGWNEVFTAYFSKDSIKVTIDVSPKDSGMVELDDKGYVSVRTTYDVPGGSNITLRAQSNDSSRFKFDKWEDSKGNFYSENPLTIVNIIADETFTAIFTPIDDEVGITVKASPPSGGRVSKKKNSDGTFTIKAQANSGYRFKGWYKDKKKLTGSTVYTVVEVHDGDVYIAYFELIKGYDARSDIVWERFPNITRIFTAPNYTVTRATMEAMASSQIAKDRQQQGDPAPAPKEYGAYSTVRERNAGKYDKSRDRSALLIDEELVTTQSDIVSAVTVDDAAAEEMAEEFTLKKFGDRYKHEILTIKQVTATEEFASEDHTYLLKDTGAEYQDNIYILYGSEQGKNSNSGIDGFNWVTCVADKAGTLRFTIPRFTPEDKFVVVHVWPE